MNYFISRPIFKNKKLLLIILILFLGTVFYGLGNRELNKKNTQAQVIPEILDSRVDAPKVKAKETINKDFTISIKDGHGNETTKIKYTIESAELQDEIFVKGELAKAIKGRRFLIFNLKITNENNQGIQINTRNYIRLSANNKDWLAPEIHNDPVETQAISTKLTRLGFPINDSDKNLFLRFGEIDGEKQLIKLNLKSI